MNGREARESGLWLKAWIAPEAEARRWPDAIFARVGRAEQTDLLMRRSFPRRDRAHH
jgi:hypothetical protein